MKIRLCLTGLAISIYMLVYKWNPDMVLICPTNGCDTVNSSAYSTFAGVPVAVMGVIGYLILLNLQMFNSKLIFLNVIYWVVSCIGFIFSLYLVYLEVYIIHSICFWCTISLLIITILFLQAIGQLSNSIRGRDVSH